MCYLSIMPVVDFIFFLRNILYAAPVNTVSKCEAHKTHYFI